ncbi:MAG: GFA family protein [Pseudomonadota bacterium]
MHEATALEGQCLCGTVQVRARLAAPVLRACHCAMCRRQNSGAFVSIANDPHQIEVEGEVAQFRSSDWAERGFCARCGSTLWYRTLHDGGRHLSAGLFEDAGGAALTLEFFADACPQGYAFAGAHQRLTTKETIALFAPEEGESQ